MVRNFILILLVVFSAQLIRAQEYLVSPTANLQLVPKSLLKGKKSLNHYTDKQRIQRDSFIYRYDTLQLPFVDDFSKNHLTRTITDTSDPRLTDTLLFRLFQGGQAVTDTNGFVTDTTYYYQIGLDSSVLQQNSLFAGIIQVYDLSVYPPTSESVSFFRPYNIYDTVNLPPDTISVEADLYQDSARYYFVEKSNDVYYTDRRVYVNNSFPIDPPTIGVATFDGLNQDGLPYDIEDDDSEEADHLTSVPINMSSVTDSVYFSFFYQPKGIAIDGPEEEDSLTVQFYNVTEEEWRTVWSTPGFSADTFTYVSIRVDSQFHQNGFQFRFKAYATVSGANDQWHVDYIYLNDNRNRNDQPWKDLAFVYPPGSLLRDHYAMPWWHFKPNPANFMVDDVDNVLVRNLFSGGILNAFNKLQIRDTINDSQFYRFPALDQFFPLGPQDTITFDYEVNYHFDPNYIDSAGTVEAIIDLDFRPTAGDQPDLIRSNDTIRSKAVLENYYAYDDGTAEAGYGINASETGTLESYVALEYNMPMTDSLGGIQIYFLPQRDKFNSPIITNQTLELIVWSSLTPATVLYENQKIYRPYYTDENYFVTYWFDTLINVPQTFFIGYRSVGPLSLNVGYDLNTNNRDKLFWSLNGQSWNSPASGAIFDGSLMMRPVFRKKTWGVGISETPKSNKELRVYPNPTSDRLNIELKTLTTNLDYQIFDLQGRIVKQGVTSASTVNVAELKTGIYLLRVQAEGRHFNRKIVVRR